MSEETFVKLCYELKASSRFEYLLAGHFIDAPLHSEIGKRTGQPDNSSVSNVKHCETQTNFHSSSIFRNSKVTSVVFSDLTGFNRTL